MKIPNSIRIAGVEYEVEIVPNLMDGANAVYGHIDYSNSIISLSDTFGTEHQKRCQILWHEILHGIRENNGMTIENEEAVVDMFAKGIYQVLQDNGARLFDIVSEDADRYARKINDLTEDKELAAKRILEADKEIVRLKRERADTVRKMQAWLKSEAITIQDHTDKMGEVVLVSDIDKITKDLLEEMK